MAFRGPVLDRALPLIEERFRLCEYSHFRANVRRKRDTRLAAVDDAKMPFSELPDS